MQVYTYEQVIEMFKESDRSVEFTKKDGTLRIMNCTRNIDSIPEEKKPKGESVKVENPTNVKVFDLDIGEWRSFNIDSIVSINRYERS